MKLSEFDINFNKFSNEEFTFTYEIDDTFFSLKENSLITNGQIKASAKCSRYDSTINIHITFNGTIDEECERCLDKIKIPVEGTFVYVLKMTGDNNLMDTENYISVDTQKYNIYDVLYENFCLSLPFRKVCEVSLKNKECKINIKESSIEKLVDTRWDELKKLKL